MPTDMVGCIRKSLERSQLSLSSYVSHSHEIGSRSKFRQKKLVAADDQTYDSCSEGSDEAESNYMEVRSYSPSTNEPYCTSETNLGIENPLGMSSEVEKYTLSQSISISDIQNLNSNVDEQSSTESVGSICSKYVKNEYQIDSMFSPCFDSKMKLVAEAPHTNYEGRYTSENSAQKLFDLDFGPKNDACFLGDPLDDNTSEICTSHQSACSDFIVSGTGKNDAELFDGEDSMFEVYMDTASHCSSSTKDNLYGLGRRIFLDIEDVEVSSNTSKSSVSGQMLNSNFCDEDHVDSSKTSLHQTYSSVVVADNDEEVGTNMVDSDPVTNKSPNINLSAACSTNRIDVCEALHSSCNSPAVVGSGRRHSQNQDMVVQDMSGQCADTQQNAAESAAINDMCVVTPEMHSHSTSGISNNGGNGHQACEEYNDDIYITGCIRKMTIMDEEKLENVGILAEEISDGREDRNGEIPEGKPAKKLLLKRVVKGTAIVGVLFLLLQLRNRNGKRETGEVSSSSSQIHKSEDAEFSSRKERSGVGGNGTYPAEKLKFGF